MTIEDGRLVVGLATSIIAMWLALITGFVARGLLEEKHRTDDRKLAEELGKQLAASKLEVISLQTKIEISADYAQRRKETHAEMLAMARQKAADKESLAAYWETMYHKLSADTDELIAAKLKKFNDTWNAVYLDLQRSHLAGNKHLTDLRREYMDLARQLTYAEGKLEKVSVALGRCMDRRKRKRIGTNTIKMKPYRRRTLTHRRILNSDR